MGRFNQGDRSGGGRNFDGNRSFGQGDRSDRPLMYDAVCSNCGQNCKVPFRPTGDKPVFCSDCFNNKDGGNGRSNKRSFDRLGSGDKKMFKVVCDKCHQDCEVPFRPTGDKPVFCSDCFGKIERNESKRNTVTPDQYAKQFEMLNNKLDDILNMLSAKALSKRVVKKEQSVVKEVKKVIKEKAVAKKGKAAPKKVVKETMVKKKVVKKVVAKKKK